jgi:hypothetical protein
MAAERTRLAPVPGRCRRYAPDFSIDARPRFDRVALNHVNECVIGRVHPELEVALPVTGVDGGRGKLGVTIESPAHRRLAEQFVGVPVVVACRTRLRAGTDR